uniref:Transmembrane protein n=1 Tax=Anguilla anguilla TaxID=7936 RepID=A0A0E9TIR6_ANGAN
MDDEAMSMPVYIQMASPYTGVTPHASIAHAVHEQQSNAGQKTICVSQQRHTVIYYQCLVHFHHGTKTLVLTVLLCSIFITVFVILFCILSMILF